MKVDKWQFSWVSDFIRFYKSKPQLAEALVAQKTSMLSDQELQYLRKSLHQQVKKLKLSSSILQVNKLLMLFLMAGMFLSLAIITPGSFLWLAPLSAIALFLLFDWYNVSQKKSAFLHLSKVIN